MKLFCETLHIVFLSQNAENCKFHFSCIENGGFWVCNRICKNAIRILTRSNIFAENRVRNVRTTTYSGRTKSTEICEKPKNQRKGKIIQTKNRNFSKGGSAEQIVSGHAEERSEFAKHNDVGQAVARFVFGDSGTVHAEFFCQPDLRQPFFLAQFRYARAQKYYSLFINIRFHIDIMTFCQYNTVNTGNLPLNNLEQYVCSGKRGEKKFPI